MVKLVRVCVFEAFNLLTMLWNYFTLVQYFFNFFFNVLTPQYRRIHGQKQIKSNSRPSLG